MSRAFIKQHGLDVLAIYSDELRGEAVKRTFFVRGAYVYETCEDGRDRQVCDRLATRGSTLRATPETLLRVIRNEYRAMRRSEKKDAA